MPRKKEPNWPLLQDLFARGAPVIAIGPGCHRIGYHETDEWKRVVARVGQIWLRLGKTKTDSATDLDKEQIKARREFLERFWAVRLRNVTGDKSGMGICKEGLEKDSPDAVRIALGTYLLYGLVEATRLLGVTVAAGAEPVMDWQHLIATFECEEEKGRAEMLGQTRRWLKLAAGLCTAVQGALNNNPDPEALAEHGLKAADVKGEKLSLLKVKVVEEALELLLETRLREDMWDISGAVVEWLSDLFWHVVISGAGVPPSQGELSFYLNLHVPSDRSPSNRFFSRAHPGEYRGPDHETLTTDLEDLLKKYDSGLEEEARDWTRPREKFAWTMALTLLESFRRERRERFTVALLSDYDLMLERAMLELLDEGEQFHVVTPATVKGDGGSRYEWLMGTFTKEADSEPNLAEPEWEWFSKRPSWIEKKPGPILVRLAGTPLFKVSEKAGKELVAVKSRETQELKPVAVFSEHDSAQAIMALTPSPNSERGLQRELMVEGRLGWKGRGWVFFGHRFSDWLPRLQLLITALMLAQGKEEDCREELPRYKIAISRRFDWPERALLKALEIETAPEELSRVATYFMPESDRPQDEETAEFLEAMRAAHELLDGAKV